MDADEWMAGALEAIGDAAVDLRAVEPRGRGLEVRPGVEILLEVGEQLPHRRRERVVDGVERGPERVAADGGRLAHAEDCDVRRLLEGGDVGVPEVRLRG